MRREESLIKEIFKLLNDNQNILSSTVAGSIENLDLDSISDIDIIVILDSVNKKKLEKIKNDLSSINLSNLNIEKEIFINDTFGPLKFNTNKNLVLHLMIYDYDSHLKHVINSPFTCFDWERSEHYIKTPLNGLSSVHKLMLKDFFSSRRGSKEYINDLNSNRISYRKYVDKNNAMVQEKFYFDLDERHLIEFAYHIVFNSIGNLIKLFENNNFKYSNEEFLFKWKKYFQDLHEKYSQDFLEISKMKQKKIYEPKGIKNIVKSFLEDFNNYLDHISKGKKRLILIRHFETDLNDGRFLGSANDISIKKVNDFEGITTNDDFSNFDIFCSPSNRCIETAEKLGFSNIQLLDELKEINYGDAEGKFFDQVLIENKYIQNAIEEDRDFKFPNGESNKDVISRILNLTSNLNNDSVFITHQGVVRSLIGSSLEIPINRWHLINIPHATPIEFIKINGKYLLNIDRILFSEIMDSFNEKI